MTTTEPNMPPLAPRELTDEQRINLRQWGALHYQIQGLNARVAELQGKGLHLESDALAGIIPALSAQRDALEASINAMFPE